MSSRQPAGKIRVLCVDDHLIVRDGVALIISQQPDMEVVGSAATGEEAVVLFQQLRPCITLMDLQLPTMSGLDAIRQIRSIDPEARIIVLTMHKGDEDVYRALNAGAATYVLKDTVVKDLIRVIRDVNVGKRPLEAHLQTLLTERGDMRALTAREFDVLERVYIGQRNRTIAAALGISEDTVRAHLKHIFEKLEVTDRTAAITVALRRGILHIR